MIRTVGAYKCYREEWKFFKDLNGSEKVATLDQETHKLEWKLPMEYQEFDYDRDMYKIVLEDGSNLLVSEEHKVYVGETENQPTRTAPSSINSHVLPNFSSENFSMKSNTNGFSLDKIGGCILKTKIAGNLDGGNKPTFKKSLSLVNIPLSSLHAKEYKREFLTPFSANITSTPLVKRNSTSLASTSSSENNLSFDIYESLSSQSFSSIMQSCLDMFSNQGGICFEDFFSCSSCFQHLQNSMYHNSSSFESGFSMTDLAICNDIFINFGSHETDNDREIFKSFYNNLSDFKLQPITETYSKFQEGKELYFLDSKNNPIKVKKDSENVALFKFYNKANNWEDIDIKKLSEDEFYTYYSAKLSSLGIFAIVSKKEEKKIFGITPIVNKLTELKL